MFLHSTWAKYEKTAFRLLSPFIFIAQRLKTTPPSPTHTEGADPCVGYWKRPIRAMPSGTPVPYRVVNGSVLVRVHGGPRIRTVKENVEPGPEPFQNRFLNSGTRIKTIYGTGLDPGLGLGRE